MKIKHSLSSSGLYLYFSGELDESHAEEVRDSLDKLIDRYSNTPSVIFNMKNLTFMDSTGIGLLIGRYKKLKQFSISSYISGASTSTEKVIELAGLYSIMPKR